ncbi:MAG: hypothetical protein CO167_08180, partial [Candidatus Marinimicrobia bacterium CG_4_9_14_3_um_filter_48_9]
RINFLYWDELLAGSDLGLYAFFNNAATAINGDSNSQLPDGFVLNQNYPNPFNPGTVISYFLPKTSQVHLTVYNVLGQQVATLVNADQSAGLHRINFNATTLSTGIYFYRLEAGEFAATQKMVLMK